MTPSIASLTEAGTALVRFVQAYGLRSTPWTEQSLDAPFMAILLERFGSVRRQMHVRYGPSNKAKRIDFRIGGTNPACVELAVRSKGAVATSLMGPQNRPELLKLTRIPQSQAKLRVLLLVDLASHELSHVHLQASYWPVSSGRGRFKRHRVQVIYVHADSTFRFMWRG